MLSECLGKINRSSQAAISDKTRASDEKPKAKLEHADPEEFKRILKPLFSSFKERVAMPMNVEIRTIGHGRGTRYQVWSRSFDFGDNGPPVRLELDETFDNYMQASARKKQILAEQERASGR